MDCDEFRTWCDRWGDSPFSVDCPDSGVRAEWHRHEQGCADCRDWAARRYCRRRGIDPDRHCCLDMALAIAHPWKDHQGPNRVLDWYASWDEYRIPISHDGYASTLIRHCPWCGRRLGDSKMRPWYDRLHALGFDDPGEQEIPEIYESDEWWRNEGPT